MASPEQRLSARITRRGTPILGIAPLPTIDIRNAITGALIVTGAATYEIGSGFYGYLFTEALGFAEDLDYVFEIDAGVLAPPLQDVDRYYGGTSDCCQQVKALWRVKALDPANPLTIDLTAGTQVAGTEIDQTVVQTPPNTTVVTRIP
jgi:hypothetical protein